VRVLASDDGVSTLTDPFRDPKDALGALASRDVTFADKLRVLRLRFALKNKTRDEIFAGDDEDETTREYLRRRGFSSRFVSRFAEPFYGGITLDRSLGASKRVFEFTFSCLASGKTVVPARGMGEIPKQLAEKACDAGTEVVMGTRVEGVTAKGKGADAAVDLKTNATTEEYDAVVVATDPHEAERLTGVGTPDGGKGCTTQYYVASEPLDVGKKIVLNADQRDDEPNQVVPVSNVAPEQSPPDTPLISATWLEPCDSEDEDTLAEGTRNVLERWGFDASIEPVQTEAVEFAQFGQPPGVHETLPANNAPEGNAFWRAITRRTRR